MSNPLQVWVLNKVAAHLEFIDRFARSMGVEAMIRRVEDPGSFMDAVQSGTVDVIITTPPPPVCDLIRSLPARTHGKEPTVIIVSEEQLAHGSEPSGSSGRDAVAPRSRHSACPEAEGPECLGEQETSGVVDIGRMCELIEVAGHDLRNVLGAVVNAIQVLAFQSIDAPLTQRRTIEFMDHQCRRMASLLDDCSEVARIAAGHVVLHLEAIEIGAVLSRTNGFYRSMSLMRGPRLELIAPAEPIWTMTDAGRLEQALLHAIATLGQASPRPSIIRLSSKADDRVELVLEPEPATVTVECTGDHRAVPRANLNLFLARSLAVMLGGEFEVGPPGVLRLPRLSDARAGPSRPSEDVTASPEPGTGSDHVLIVDDNLDSVRGLGLLLAQVGCRVRVTSDIAEALEALPMFRPDMILIDLYMPVMDGRKLAHRIRQEYAESCPVLVGVTGTAEKPEGDHHPDWPFDHFLTKPIRLDQVVALLSHLGASSASDRGEQA